ncbi:MAG: 5-(carboxyamino)imidazole ribonucleotide synthase [Chloroflexi bacterium]|nr:5-(carboxyamino)imidazole ribonucleotide synthase [Chloroflexota bacterium]
MINTSKKLPTGSVIGIIGGGQLGRMLSQSAKILGYKTVILDPVPLCPAGQVSDHQIVGNYNSLSAANSLSNMCDVVTYEFENVDLNCLLKISENIDVFPSPEILKISSNRILEKEKLRKIGAPTVEFFPINSIDDFNQAQKIIGFPMIIKTASSGYDGKGQKLLKSEHDIDDYLINSIKIKKAFIAEDFLDFNCEISVICARNIEGEIITFFPSENIHENHILDISIVPPRVSKKIISSARNLAKNIAESLDLVGLLAVEMFLTKNNELLINELAPRPHNSGHYTMNGCETSQFTQLIKILTKQPLGNSNLSCASVMINLLGDLWINNSSKPNLEKLNKSKNIFVHLYGKDEPRIGRKMGHINITSNNISDAYIKAMEIKSKLSN